MASVFVSIVPHHPSVDLCHCRINHTRLTLIGTALGGPPWESQVAVGRADGGPDGNAVVSNQNSPSFSYPLQRRGGGGGTGVL